MSSSGLLTFVLPGEWWTLDVRGEPAEVAGRIKHLVKQAIGMRDDLAKVRHDLGERFATLAAEGRKVKADHVYLGRTTVGSAPLPATLLVGRPGVVLPAGGDRADRLAVLLSLLPGSPTEVEHPELAIARTVNQPGEAANLSATYWVDVPGKKGLATFVFGSTMASLEEPMLALFDLVCATIRVEEAPVPQAV